MRQAGVGSAPPAVRSVSHVGLVTQSVPYTARSEQAVLGFMFPLCLKVIQDGNVTCRGGLCAENSVTQP